MKEVQQILELWAGVKRAGEEAVLATVVGTSGSSYRLPGARMLLTRTGQRAGSISGGCLEDDLVKKAWWLTEAGPVLRRYDTTPEGEIATGFGMGCNGIVHVLLERAQPGGCVILDLLRDVSLERRVITVAHILEDGRIGERLIGEALPEVKAFVETLTPPVHLLLFGAGDDAVPLASLAKFLGWRVSVFDGRPHYAKRDKFPQVDALVAQSVADSAATVSVDPWTVAVLMTHSFSQDLDTLRELANRPLRYIGMLGPRKRSAQLLADAGLEPERLRAALHSPMGLDIGADGPQQVALAVVAEIQAVLNGRQGGLLRTGTGSIHAPDAAGQVSSWVQSITFA